jgi:predicted dinucleotide-binding enzyme
MRIGIIGSGFIGASLARLFVAAGHEVAISNSRGPQSLSELVGEVGPRLRARTVDEAIDFAEVVVEAIPFGRYRDLPAAKLRGKIVISAANYYPGRDGQIDLGGQTQSELIAAHLPGARLVKAFNTIWYQHLLTQGDRSKPIADRRVVFLAGDDAQAKQVVATLITELGFGPLDTGSLQQSGRQEPGAAIYNKDVTVAEAQKLLAE